MQTQPTPISQIVSPNATPGASNRAQPSGGGDGDFQRTLNRQIEQRQASRNLAQAQPQAARPAQAPAPAPVPATPAQPAKAAAREATPAEPAAPQDKPATAAGEAAAPATPATKDSAPADTTAAAAAPAVPPPADPAAAMLALVGSIQLAMQTPAAPAKEAADLAPRASASAIKADGKSLAATQLLAAGQGSGKAAATLAAQADGGDFADSLGQAQGKAAVAPGTALPPGKAEPGKLALDAQLAATAKAGTAVAEPSIKDAPADLTRLAAQLQPGALQQAAAAVAVPADKLAGRVGTPAWDQQLGQKVVWMAAGGDQSATLTLNPPDLGPLQVVLTVTNDQADAAFMSAQPEVRQALEAAMPRLREMMGEAGIAFGSATVSAGTPGQQDPGNREAAGGRRGGGQGGGTTGGEIAIAPSTGTRGRATLGAVDTFA